MKTERVKENVELAVVHLATLRKARDELHAYWRKRLEYAGREVETAGNKLAVRVEALEERVLGVLDNVQFKLAEQDKTLAKLTARTVSPPGPACQWTEVVKRTGGGPPKQPKQPKQAITNVETKKRRLLAPRWRS